MFSDIYSNLIFQKLIIIFYKKQILNKTLSDQHFDQQTDSISRNKMYGQKLNGQKHTQLRYVLIFSMVTSDLFLLMHGDKRQIILQCDLAFTTSHPVRFGHHYQ